MNTPTEAQRAQALQQFTDYFVKNYPGPDTVIFDPKWHAPKLFNAALSALSAALAVEAGAVTPMSFFSENVDRWGAAEWFDRLANAIREQDKACVAKDDISFETYRMIAASSAMTLVRDHEATVRSALTPSPASSAVEGEAVRIADAVLAWMVKYDLIDAGNEYRAEDIVSVLDDLAPAAPGKEGL